MTEIFRGDRPLGVDVLLRPDDDLPEIAIVPHKLSAAFKRAVFDGDVRGVPLNLTVAAGPRRPEHGDDGPGHVGGGDVSEREVRGGSAGCGRDHDRPGVGLRRPRVFVAPGRVEDAAGEVAAGPGELKQIFGSEHHAADLFPEVARKVKPCAMRHHRDS